MNNATHTHRLYMVLAMIAGMMLLSIAPAAAGVDTPAPPSQARQEATRTSPQDMPLDPWAVGKAVRATRTTPQGMPLDPWAVGEAVRSSGTSPQDMPLDPWAVGEALRASTSDPAASVVDARPSTTPIPLSAVVLGVLLAAVLGAGAAVLAGHRRRIRSAH